MQMVSTMVVELESLPWMGVYFLAHLPNVLLINCGLELGWDLRKEEDGSRLYERDYLDEPIKAFKIEGTLARY